MKRAQWRLKWAVKFKPEKSPLIVYTSTEGVSLFNHPQTPAKASLSLARSLPVSLISTRRHTVTVQDAGGIIQSLHSYAEEQGGGLPPHTGKFA